MKYLLALALALSLPPLAQAAKTEKWSVDPSSSSVNWDATKIGGSHQGSVKIKSGALTTDKAGLAGGEFLVDMNSLAITDGTSEEMKKKLDAHLRSDDFFSVEKNPTAAMKITKVGPMKDGKQEVSGNLTIKGITKPISFPATITNDGKGLNAKAEFQVDRTAYDIKYRSLKFFSDLGDKVIHDKFTLKVDLNAKK
ncbi:MAG: YceI family protein [Bacteriovoracia bacterium]